MVNVFKEDKETEGMQQGYAGQPEIVVLGKDLPYTLGELVDNFKPMRGRKQIPAFMLLQVPTGEELQGMGAMKKGEMGVVAVPGRKLRVIWGDEQSVYAKECLLHNHPEAALFPSQGDAKGSYIDELNDEYISCETGIAHIRYHFRKKADKVTIDWLVSGHRREKPMPDTDDSYREKKYSEPTKISGLPINEVIRPEDEEKGIVSGTYDITIIPWEAFLQKYHPDIFWKMFRRKSNWAAFFSSRSGYTLSQTPQLHPSPQLQT